MKTSGIKDHRQIGQELDLFSFHEYAPGAIFWHPKGWIIYRTLQEFLRNTTLLEGYLEISTPVLIKTGIFKKSGHLEHFRENMFNFQIEDQAYSLKPMNCPESAIVYGSQIRSYIDLPIKLSEYGILHRNELTGVLGGAFRVRQFTIDDAHLFVRPDQIGKEISKLLRLVIEVYKSLGFKPRFYLATRPDKAMGDVKTWKEAEKDLEIALKNAKVNFGIKHKDGAFYGPKIDIHIKDSHGRDWQLATIQLDFQIPQKMEIFYVDKDGKKKQPVMIHCGITGSIERFIGILLEHTQGNLPFWLSPVQISILPITERQNREARKIYEKLLKSGIRAEFDNRGKTLQSKIRDATLQKVPYMGIIGDKEIGSESISVRTREGKDLGLIKIPEFLKKLKEEIDKKI
ncbi:MAG: threonine--tRNA ligase [Candidatus Levybacteria bacterium RIFCSPLOWO2_01_FULL_38_13]|nr:MAG: threonine--tRNA ligase [Candidatus Levybacteria bacterium RIFCSPHIGHO2_01_FULL_41_15]OGH35276.1 MAG: threonine--tRNA ligase [Candidatus Levybacteria bacterium RIFCSPLOWO2_01_FULL_38_13]